MAVLGLDLGTTGVRALLLDRAGLVVGAATSEYALSSPSPGWMEQNPEDWWKATGDAVRQALIRAGLSGENVRSVAVSGQMHGATLLDRRGEVIRPCILWNDQRSAPQCREIIERLGPERLLLLTGNMPLAGFTAPKLLWVREHEAANWARVAHVLLPRDYLNYRLTGALSCEPSDAAGTLLYDVGGREWSTAMLDALEIPAAFMGPVTPSAGVVGTLSDAAALHTGLRAGTPVMAGGADNACAAAGCGVVSPGRVLCSIGTSGTVVAPVSLETPNPGHNLHLFCHVSPDANYLMGVVLSAGGALRWYRDTVCHDLIDATARDTDAYAALTDEAETIAPGSEGLLFLPYLTGERTPHGSAAARGVFYGLSARHGRAHLTRAVLEGVTYALAQSWALLRESGVTADVIRLTGGGARSALWRQLIADVFECPVASMPVDEGPAYGAALLAAVGAGDFSSIEQAAEHITPGAATEPMLANRSAYRQGAGRFADLYRVLEPSFLADAGRQT